MNEVSILGVDLAKNVFQLHGAGADGPEARNALTFTSGHSVGADQ